MHAPYNPEIHTYDALQSQIEQNVGHGVLVGSLGRAAYLGSQEFDERRQDPRYKRTADGAVARDLDYFGTYDLLSKPYPVDRTAFSGDEAALWQRGGKWYLSHDGELQAQIDDEVMRPVSAMIRLGGRDIHANVSTLALNFALLNLIGKHQRPQDRLATRLLAAHLTRADIDELQSSGFAPFWQVARKNGHRRGVPPIPTPSRGHGWRRRLSA